MLDDVTKQSFFSLNTSYITESVAAQEQATVEAERALAALQETQRHREGLRKGAQYLLGQTMASLDKARIEGEPLMEFWMKDSTRELGESFVKYGVDVALRKNAANPTADNALEEARKRIEELKSGALRDVLDIVLAKLVAHNLDMDTTWDDPLAKDLEDKLLALWIEDTVTDGRVKALQFIEAAVNTFLNRYANLQALELLCVDLKDEIAIHKAGSGVASPGAGTEADRLVKDVRTLAGAAAERE